MNLYDNLMLNKLIFVILAHFVGKDILTLFYISWSLGKSVVLICLKSTFEVITFMMACSPLSPITTFLFLVSLITYQSLFK